MTAALYCSASDVYDHGIPRGSIPSQARVAASASTSADAITLEQHGFETDTPVRFRAEAGGSLPSPLAEGTTYYAIAVDEDTFQVTAAEGGSAIDLTTAGERIVVIGPSPMDAAREFGSRAVDDLLPAHVVPIDESAVPPIVRITAAELAAWKLVGATGGQQSKALADIITAAQARIDRWAKGVPVRNPDAPAPANLAVSAGASSACNDSRGWNRYGGL